MQFYKHINKNKIKNINNFYIQHQRYFIFVKPINFWYFNQVQSSQLQLQWLTVIFYEEKKNFFYSLSITSNKSQSSQLIELTNRLIIFLLYLRSLWEHASKWEKIRNKNTNEYVEHTQNTTCIRKRMSALHVC